MVTPQQTTATSRCLPRHDRHTPTTKYNCTCFVLQNSPLQRVRRRENGKNTHHARSPPLRLPPPLPATTHVADTDTYDRSNSNRINDGRASSVTSRTVSCVRLSVGLLYNSHKPRNNEHDKLTEPFPHTTTNAARRLGTRWRCGCRSARRSTWLSLRRRG